MARRDKKPKREEYNVDDKFIDEEEQNGADEHDEDGEEELATEQPPNSIDPYMVLDLEKDATQDQIKTAYRKAALKFHPDKVPASEKDAAHGKFQEIAFAFAVLSDPRRRSRYDATGRTSESFDDEDDFNWTDFFKAQFQDVITGDSIAKFKKKYQGSEEEKLDVIAAYIDFEGNMNRLFQTVMLANPLEDEERFRKWIDEEVAAGRVESYKAYANESRRSKEDRMELSKREGKAAKAHAKKLGVYDKIFGDDTGSSGQKAEGDTSGLAALIQQRQKARSDNFLANLEAKYVGQQKSSKKRRRADEAIEEVDEPPEELFQKNRATLETSKAKKAKASEETKGGASRRSKRTKR